MEDPVPTVPPHSRRQLLEGSHSPSARQLIRRPEFEAKRELNQEY